MTPPLNVELKEPEVNWRNFRIACNLAVRCGVTTVMFTGKGEPTLFPDQITKYLRVLNEFQFPIVELQSNGIMFVEKREVYSKHLRTWYDLGITTIAVSIVHYLPEKNQQIYLPYRSSYIDLQLLVRILHDHGISVRLATVMLNGYIDSRRELQNLIAFARDNQVEQLTIRPVNRPASSRNPEVYDWTAKNHLQPEQLADVRDFLVSNGKLLMTLPHGAQVYDLDGQNVCLTDSLTVEANSDALRQLIFFPDGHLRYDWQYPGAILL